MKKKNKKVKDGAYLSWKELLQFYSKVKIPWVLIIIVALLAFGVKEAENRLVPFQTDIMTGAITRHGFLGGFIAMSIFYAFIEALQGSLNEFGGVMMARNVRRGIWGRIIHLPMSFFNKRDPQKLVSRVTQDTQGAYGAITSVVQLLSVFYGLYTNFISMYETYESLALIMLSAIPLSLITAVIVGRLQYKVDSIFNNAVSSITNFFGERLPNVLHIKTSNMEDEEYKKGVEENDRRFKEEMRSKKIFVFLAPLGSMAQYVNQIILLAVASAMVRAEVMEMYHLVNLYNYFILFMGNAMMLSGVWQNVKSSHGACATIARIANTEPEKMGVGEKMPSEPQDIVFENVSYAYDDTRDILTDVSFVIPKGMTTAIVGENGSGKSTIIRMLERFDDPNGGRIRVGGTPLDELDLCQWRDSVGYLFQGDQIVKGSIRENLTYGLNREYTEEELINAVKLANAYDFIMAKEQGFETEISRFDSKLSGGEAQRLAIARIILKNPQYLIMDEATSGVDAVSEAEVMKNITDFMSGKTIIMVSHDMDMISKADNIVVLKGGVIETGGSFGKVSGESELFNKFLAAQPIC